MAQLEPKSVLEIPTILGEGPLWSTEQNVLYWLDIYRPSINRFNPQSGGNVALRLREPVYAAGFASGGRFVVALESGFALISNDCLEIRHIANPIEGQPVNFNDGKVDRRGRFWSGTMASDWQSPIGSLYRLDGDGSVHVMDRGIVLANGLAWSPDDSVLYFTDFARSTVYAYPFDLRSGSIGKRQPLIVLAEGDGFPDGITVDAEGYIWVAHWDGWCVTRHDPKGRETDRIPFPVPRPTSVIFGGRDLQTLYVTSATMRLTPEDLRRAPLSGALFSVETGAKGLPEPHFL